jgi:hypothetical protein
VTNGARAVMTTTTLGSYWDAGTLAPSPRDRSTTIRLGVPYRAFRIAARSDVKVAHYLAIVKPGLMGATKLFRGVNRKLKHYDDMEGDKTVYAYVWRPDRDVWPVIQLDGSIKLQFREPPANRVFATLVRPYEKADAFGIEGAILTWNWMDADPNMCPVDEEDRYEEPIW